MNDNQPLPSHDERCQYNASSLRLHVIAPIVLSVILLLALVAYLIVLPPPEPMVYGPLLLIILGLLVWASRIVWRDFCEPMMSLRNWLFLVRGGNLSTRLPSTSSKAFTRMAQDINDIGLMLQKQSENTEQQLAEHVKHLRQKRDSLRILYDVAASVNTSRSLDDLLTRFLHTLKDVANARAATVRLLTNDNRMRLVASTGLDKDMIERERFIPAESCACGQVITENQVLTVDTLLPCGKTVGREFFDQDSDLSMIAVPLQYRDTTLGVYNLFVEKGKTLNNDDISSLFLSIGRHLGVAIEKARLDSEASRLILMDERTRMAHELHDSLAQTLVSLRFQVRVLDETLHQGDECTTWEALELLENTLDEANTELRELIYRFQAPVSKRGLVPSVERAIERFRSESPIPVFLQKDWEDQELDNDQELQVLRIIQEGLANIRKHSQAKAVRILMRSTKDHRFKVLIEDDGIGMSLPDENASTSLGEHIGLSILKQRAKQLGGEIKIESEPGEGTRIELMFSARKDQGTDNVHTFNIEKLYEPQATRH
ncbi:MAG: ATP-binding protein [bacterium]